jgi:hypothetical protein
MEDGRGSMSAPRLPPPTPAYPAYVLWRRSRLRGVGVRERSRHCGGDGDGGVGSTSLVQRRRRQPCRRWSLDLLHRRPEVCDDGQNVRNSHRQDPVSLRYSYRLGQLRSACDPRRHQGPRHHLQALARPVGTHRILGQDPPPAPLARPSPVRGEWTRPLPYQGNARSVLPHWVRSRVLQVLARERQVPHRPSQPRPRVPPDRERRVPSRDPQFARVHRQRCDWTRARSRRERRSVDAELVGDGRHDGEEPGGRLHQGLRQVHQRRALGSRSERVARRSASRLRVTERPPSIASAASSTSSRTGTSTPVQQKPSRHPRAR